jgi:hypothetical protein
LEKINLLGRIRLRLTASGSIDCLTFQFYKYWYRYCEEKLLAAPDPHLLTPFVFDFIAYVVLQLLSNRVTGTGTGNERK